MTTATPPPPVPPPGGYPWPGRPADLHAHGRDTLSWRDPQADALAAVRDRLMAAHIAELRRFLDRWAARSSAAGGAGDA